MSSCVRSLLLAVLVSGLAAPSARALPPGAVNGVIASSDASTSAIASAGFNAVTLNPYVKDLDAASARGLKGIVWLGGYDNESCEFAKPDRWIRRKLKAIRRHRAVVAYHVDDEPKSTECPSAPSQIAARSKLVKSLDRGALTVLTHFRSSEFRDFANVTDVLGVVSYPCSHEYGCRFWKIRADVRAARAGGWKRLWAVPQAFGDDYYRIPRPDELGRILAIWDRAGVEGSLAYEWDKSSPDALNVHPELWPLFGRRSSRSTVQG
jgi:hypothetical protein